MNSNKTYFVLMGISNSGKTSALKMLIDKLVDNSATCEMSSTLNEDIRIRLSLNGKIIGITTRGDTLNALEKDFDILGDCDVYVFASHLKGATRKFSHEVSKGYRLIEHRKWSTSLNNKVIHNRINQSHADELFTEILAIL